MEVEILEPLGGGWERAAHGLHIRGTLTVGDENGFISRTVEVLESNPCGRCGEALLAVDRLAGVSPPCWAWCERCDKPPDYAMLAGMNEPTRIPLFGLNGENTPEHLAQRELGRPGARNPPPPVERALRGTNTGWGSSGPEERPSFAQVLAVWMILALAGWGATVGLFVLFFAKR